MANSFAVRTYQKPVDELPVNKSEAMPPASPMVGSVMPRGQDTPPTTQTPPISAVHEEPTVEIVALSEASRRQA